MLLLQQRIPKSLPLKAASACTLYTLKKETLNVICAGKNSLSLAVFTNTSNLKLVKER